MGATFPFHARKGYGSGAVHSEACLNVPFADHALSRSDWAVTIKFYEARNWIAGAYGSLVPELLTSRDHGDFKAKFVTAMKRAGTRNWVELSDAYQGLYWMSIESRYLDPEGYEEPGDPGFVQRMADADADLATILADPRVMRYRANNPPPVPPAPAPAPQE